MGFNYKELTKSTLRDYVMVKNSMVDTLDRLAMLENRKIKITTSYGVEGVQSSPTKTDDKLINLLAEIALVTQNVDDNIQLIKDVENSMKGLSDKEKDIVLELYGYSYKNNKVEKLCEKYAYEKTQIYKIANDSLYKMSYILYGDG